jgi:hypothetical protein
MARPLSGLPAPPAVADPIRKDRFTLFPIETAFTIPVVVLQIHPVQMTPVAWLCQFAYPRLDAELESHSVYFVRASGVAGFCRL